MKRICKDCGREFEITAGEEKFFKEKGLSLPKRCKECRSRNKAAEIDKAAQGEQPAPTVQKRDNKPIIIAVLLAAVLIFFAIITSGSHFKSDVTQQPQTTAAVTAAQETQPQTSADEPSTKRSGPVYAHTFKNTERLVEHFEKHGEETGCSTKEEYLEKANALIANPDALTKTEAEDGDIVYFLPSTGEICFMTQGGKIRTYFIADNDYFERQ